MRYIILFDFLKLLVYNNIKRLETTNHVKFSRERGIFMPLAFADVGTTYTIRRLGGTPEVKKHLENLGFAAGGEVTVVNTVDGNLIVNVKDARVAISRELAQKIMV